MMALFVAIFGGALLVLLLAAVLSKETIKRDDPWK